MLTVAAISSLAQLAMQVIVLTEGSDSLYNNLNNFSSRNSKNNNTYLFLLP